MSEQVDSAYAFIYNHYADRNYVDIYLPMGILGQFQLAPGAAVLIQGLDAPQIEALQLRPRKGSENPTMGKIPFIASIRFPNRPGVLHTFLSEAESNGIRFASIRAQGLRSEEKADILCEGNLATVPPLFDPIEAIRVQIMKSARSTDGELLSASPVYYSDLRSGQVLSSLYRLDVPVLRGSYRKVRFSVLGRFRPFRLLQNTLALTRVSLDIGRTTLTLDLSIMRLPVYLLSFESPNLPQGAPVTRTILTNLPDTINVDSLDAFEYVKYDPQVAKPGAKIAPVRVGVIEMLLTAPESTPFAASDLQNNLKSALASHNWWDNEHAKVEIASLAEALSREAKVKVPEDTDCRGFQKILNDGQYAIVEHLGDGTYGKVNKYVDLVNHRLVAGKHVINPKEFREEELEALVAASQQKSSSHLVSYLDFFIDGDFPVLVTDCVENVLANHAARIGFAQPKNPHAHPVTLEEFLDMALQLLRGLLFLHTPDSQTGESTIHGDVKPANIGFTRIGEQLVWKLLDFGLTRKLAKGVPVEVTGELGGTPAYASPQVYCSQKRLSNDIYALGIVLFEVLNDWRHPTHLSENDLRQQKRGAMMIPEVAAYASYLEQGETGEEPPGYAVSRWSLGSPFANEGLTTAGNNGLRNIIYRMIDFSANRRFGSCEEVIEAFEEWAQECGLRSSEASVGGESGDARAREGQRE